MVRSTWNKGALGEINRTLMKRREIILLRTSVESEHIADWYRDCFVHPRSLVPRVSPVAYLGCCSRPPSPVRPSPRPYPRDTSHRRRARWINRLNRDREYKGERAARAFNIIVSCAGRPGSRGASREQGGRVGVATLGRAHELSTLRDP